MMVHNELKDAVILVFANKADMPTARDVGELTQMYGFDEVQDHEWKIQPCCALTGEGLNEGLDWLADRLSARLKSGYVSRGATGLHVTRMPENQNRANLNDLTIRTTQFAAAKNQNSVDYDDLESGINPLEQSIKKHESAASSNPFQ